MAQVYDFFSKKKIDLSAQGSESILATKSSPEIESEFQMAQLTTISSEKIITLDQARKHLLDQDKRNNQRTILSDLVSVYAILPERGLLKVDVHNLGEKGLAFDVESFQGAYELNEKVAMRVYLNHKSYFPFEVEIKHVTPVEEEGVFRHGATFTGENTNNVALSHLIKFLEAVSSDLREDRGDLMIPNIS